MHRADKQIARKASRHRASRTVRTLGAISEIGDQPPLRAIGVAIVTTGLFMGRPRLAAAGVRALAAHTVATWAKAAIKGRIDRSRPNRWLGGGAYKAKRGRSDDPGLNSFPSGHTAGAVAMAAALARDYPRLAVPVNGAASAIAAIQVPRGKHHLSDILVGALIGGGAEWLVSKLASRARGRFLLRSAVDRLASSRAAPLRASG